jgi:serine/threonine protein kinase
MPQQLVRLVFLTFQQARPRVRQEDRLGSAPEEYLGVTKAVPLAPDMEPFPGYRLSRHLGRGGWGEVWQARRADGRHVALKFLPSDCALAGAQEIRALQSIQQLEHPNLIRIDKIWGWSGYVVIAMELAEGSLLDLLDLYMRDYGTCIVPQHLCHYLGQAAEALDFLNTRQHYLNGVRVAVRHCDVKPSNLLVLQSVVKVADFSLSVLTTSRIGSSHRGGTLNYIAPEVFQGQLSDRTDQYALAVTYVELRTSHFPFPGMPSKYSPGYVRPEPDLVLLEPWERPILARALSPVPQDRWPTCTDMIKRLANQARQARVAVRS